MPGISTSRSATSRAVFRERRDTTSSPRPTSATTGQVGFQIEQRGQSSSHERLIVRQEQPYGCSIAPGCSLCLLFDYLKCKTPAAGDE